jgi:hypothetical protein
LLRFARNDGFKPLTRAPLRYSLTAKQENPQAKIKGGCHDADAKSRSSEPCRRQPFKNRLHPHRVCRADRAPALSRAAYAGDIPTFAVDAAWPKPLPNNWILGQVGGITVDWQGHIWLIHRPRSLTDDEKGAALTPPRSKCCISAPPVLEFDTDGNLLRLGRTRRRL